MTRDDLPKSTEDRLQALEQTVKQLSEMLASMQYDEIDLDEYEDDVPSISSCYCSSCLHMAYTSGVSDCGITGLACSCVYCNPGKE